MDEFINNFGILILIGIQAIIFGWFLGFEKVLSVLNEFSTFKVGKTWIFILKYILPILIIGVWAYGLIELVNNESSVKIIIDLIIMAIVVGLSILFTKLKPKTENE